MTGSVFLMRAACGAVAIAGLLLETGCGGGGTKPTPLASRAASPRLATALLEAAQLTGLPRAPASGFARQPMTRVHLTVDPDPRAPCGARIKDAPSLQKGALAVFSSPSRITVVQWVNRLSAGRARTILALNIANTRPGCPDFDSTTDTGATQVNHLVQAVPLMRSVADQENAVITRFGQRAPFSYGTEIVLRVSDCLMYVVVFSDHAPPTVFVRGLAAIAARRLRSASAAC